MYSSFYKSVIKNAESKLKTTNENDCPKTRQDNYFAHKIKYAYRLTAKNKNQ